MSSLYCSHNIAYYSKEFSNILVFIAVIKTVNMEQMLMGKPSRTTSLKKLILTNCGGRYPSDFNIYRSLPQTL